MGDITCRKCGEPWDAYGVHHGDMTEEESKKFLRGEGCPSCCFGQKTKGNVEMGNRFLESLVDPANTDEDPIKLLNNVSSGDCT